MPKTLPELIRRTPVGFWLVAAAFLCASSGALVSRAVGDALLLAVLGSEALPLMYVLGALTAGFGAFLCARASQRFSSARLAVLLGQVLILANVLVLASWNAYPQLAAVLAYLSADVTGFIVMLLFWAVASEVFTIRQSKRMFGLVGAIGTAFCLPTGILIGPSAARFGTESLTIVVSILLLGFVLAMLRLDRQLAPARARASRFDRRGLVPPNRRSLLGLRGDRQFLSIAALACGFAVVQTLVDFQFKSSYAPLLDSEGLAAVFGQLYACTSVASLLIQVFLIHQILHRGGLFLALCLLPIGVTGAATLALAQGTLSWVFVLKAVEVTMQLAVVRPSVQLLYRGVRRESRVQAQALAEGVCRPVAVGTVGAVLVGALGVGQASAVAGLVILAAALCLALARWAYHAYVDGLMNSIEAGKMDESDDATVLREPAVEHYIRSSLLEASDQDLIELLKILPQLGQFAASKELESALARDNPSVKLAVLHCLRDQGGSDYPALTESLLRHDDPAVRRAAIQVLGQHLEGVRAQGLLEPATADPVAEVRASAAAVLINSGPPETAEEALAALRRLAESNANQDRLAVAQVLGEIPADATGTMLEGLLAQSDEAVVTAALNACQRHPDPGLTPLVIPHLATPRTAMAASDALVAIGPHAVEALLMAIDASQGPGHLEALGRLARVLARIGDPRPLPHLRHLISRLDPAERYPLLQAYSQLVAAQESVLPHLRNVDLLIAAEMGEARARVQTMDALPASESTELLRGTLTELIRFQLRNLFLLISIRMLDPHIHRRSSEAIVFAGTPGAAPSGQGSTGRRQLGLWQLLQTLFAAIREALMPSSRLGTALDMQVVASSLLGGSTEYRAQAHELLDNVLPPQLKGPLFELLDWRHSGREQDDAATNEAIASLLSGREASWTIAAALLASAELPAAALRQNLMRLLHHDSAVVRETVLATLDRLGDSDAFAAACQELSQDPDPGVRRLIQSRRGFTASEPRPGTS